MNRSKQTRPFTKQQMLEKKRRYIQHNKRLVAKGGRPRPLPFVFRNLTSQPKFVGPLLPNGRRTRRRPRQVQRKNFNQGAQKVLPPPLEKAVINLEKKTGKPVVIASVAQPQENAFEWDFTGLQLLIEIMAVDLSLDTDLFFQITPLEFAYHCVYVACTYMARFGGLSGASWVPVNADTSNLPVPIALAKYLEYLAPYTSKDIKVSTTAFLSTTSNFFPASPGYTALGYETNTFLNRPQWFPNWSVMPAQTSSLDNHIVFGFNATDLITFNTFVNTPQVRGRVGKAIQAAVKTIELRKIAISAPDSSAYARLTVPYTVDNTTAPLAGAVRGLDDNFDPEMTLILAPSAGNAANYTNLFTKPYPTPTIRRQNSLLPDAGQLASVLQYLGNHGSYAPGKTRNSLGFNTQDGTKYLKTLYPQEQPIDGIGLSNLINQSHAALIAAQSSNADPGVDLPDAGNTLLAIETLLAYTALQKRISQSEVLHWNTPPCYTPSELLNVVSPQLFYTDASVSNVEFPLPIAAAISAIGPVVVDGVLRVPSSDYNDVLTHAEGPVAGPYYFVINGFDTSRYDTAFPRHTTYSSAWGTLQNASPLLLPIVVVDNVTSPVTILNQLWVDNNFAAQPDYSNMTTVHPAVPTGSVATAILNKYVFELQKGQYGQSIVTCPVTTRVDGDLNVMTATISRDAEDFTVASTQPLGFGSASDTANNTVILSGAISKMTSLNHLQSEDAALVALVGVGDVDGLDVSPPANQEAFIRLKKFKFQVAGATYEDLDRDIAGSFTTDIPWGTGTAGLINQICRSVMIPTSKSADSIHREKDATNFDPVALFKKQAGPILERAMRGAPVTNVPIRKYVRANQTYQNLPPKKGFFNKAKDAVGTAVKVTETAIKGAKTIAEIGAMFV